MKHSPDPVVKRHFTPNLLALMYLSCRCFLDVLYTLNIVFLCFIQYFFGDQVTT